jgi:hypothetical protein
LGHSYLQPILIHRLSGGAFVRASAFRLETGSTSVDMGSVFRVGIIGKLVETFHVQVSSPWS